MKRSKLRFQAMLLVAIMFVGLAGVSGTLQAQSVKPVTVQSSKDFNGTISALKKAVSGGGMMVLAEINQGKILEMTGLKINAHSFFIGNPNMGKKAFSADPAVGVVIPVRVNLYEKGGKTYINYFKPSDLLAGSGNQQTLMIAKMLDNKLGKMVKMLSK